MVDIKLSLSVPVSASQMSLWKLKSVMRLIGFYKIQLIVQKDDEGDKIVGIADDSVPAAIYAASVKTIFNEFK